MISQQPIERYNYWRGSSCFDRHTFIVQITQLTEDHFKILVHYWGAWSDTVPLRHKIHEYVFDERASSYEEAVAKYNAWHESYRILYEATCTDVDRFKPLPEGLK